MSFFYPEVLWLLIPLALWFFQTATTQNHPFHPKITLSSAQHNPALTPLIAALLIIALARPIILEPHQKEHTTQTLFIALDVSASMRATDIAPSRLEAAKSAIAKLIQQSPHRIALLIFTSNPLIIAPPTSDKKMLLEALNSIDPRNILTKSTDIQKLLDFTAQFGEDIYLAIFSDGGEQKLVKPPNITLFAVATATKSGALIPTDEGYLKDNGHLVVSRLNPLFLKAADNVYDLHNFQELLKGMKTKEQSQQNQKVIELFGLFILAALALLLHSFTNLFDRFKRVLPFLFILHLHASILDEFAIERAYKLYYEGNYQKSAQIFSKLPYQEARYGLAKSLLHLGKYDEALKIFTSLKSKEPTKKRAILFDIAFCYEKMRRFDKARSFYAKAASLGDKTALKRLQKILFAKNPKKPLLPFSKQKKVHAKTKGSGKRNSGGSNMQTALLSGNAKGGEQKQKGAIAKGQGIPMSSKVYELINKGYIDEKHPW